MTNITADFFSVCAFLSVKLYCFCFEQVLRGWLSVSPNYDEVIQWLVT